MSRPAIAQDGTVSSRRAWKRSGSDRQRSDVNAQNHQCLSLSLPHSPPPRRSSWKRLSARPGFEPLPFPREPHSRAVLGLRHSTNLQTLATRRSLSSHLANPLPRVSRCGLGSGSQQLSVRQTSRCDGRFFCSADGPAKTVRSSFEDPPPNGGIRKTPLPHGWAGKRSCLASTSSNLEKASESPSCFPPVAPPVEPEGYSACSNGSKEFLRRRKTR